MHTSSESISNMDLPRAIPSGLKRRIIFGNPLVIAAFIPMIVGIILTTVFASLADFKSFKFKGNEPRVKGSITEMTQTNSRVNHQNIYKYVFSYKTPDGIARTGISYDTWWDINDGVVDVEYLADEPQTARIVGMRGSEFSPFVALAGLMPFLIGLIFLIIVIRKGRKNVYLVRNGILTEGKVISMQRTNTRINNRYVHIVTFQFLVNNAPVTAVTRTHLIERITDEAKEKIIYDSNDPTKANFVDAMPKSVRRFFEGGM
ncbi:MAG TPA: DUF3592 domain-containing protein [Bacteroidia bacterium]|jgi:hypothetical protein|nr:DUF3592 domain-containing protein [Bacteroidia bacterium]